MISRLKSLLVSHIRRLFYKEYTQKNIHRIRECKFAVASFERKRSIATVADFPRSPD